MIVLMGVAGSGKSMQGRMFADEHGYAWISTGELLRVLVTGRRRQEMLAGKLLSDEEVINVLDKTFDLIDLSQEFVLDGFPRSIPQAVWLINQIHLGRIKFTAVFNLVVSTEAVKKRLLNRGRPDDTEEAIKTRFQEYEEVAMPVISHFKSGGLPVYDINADQDPMVVHDDILHFLNHKNS